MRSSKCTKNRKMAEDERAKIATEYRAKIREHLEIDAK